LSYSPGFFQGSEDPVDLCARSGPYLNPLAPRPSPARRPTTPNITISNVSLPPWIEFPR